MNPLRFFAFFSLFFPPASSRQPGLGALPKPRARVTGDVPKDLLVWRVKLLSLEQGLEFYSSLQPQISVFGGVLGGVSVAPAPTLKSAPKAGEKHLKTRKVLIFCCNCF